MATYILKQPDGSTFPPMSIDELRRLATEGKISSEHTIQIVGGNAWHPASKIQGLVNPPQYSSSPTPSTNVQPSSQQSPAQDKMSSIKNASKNVQGQIANKLPLVKGNLVRLKAAIMKSPKNMAITAGIAIVVLLINFIVFFGGGGINGHLDSLKSAGNNVYIAANSGDAYAVMNSMEELIMAMESMNSDSEALIQELSGMNEIQRNALALSFLGHMKRSKAEPSDAARLSMMTQFGKDPSLAIRFQELENRLSNLKLNPLLEDLLKPNN